MNHEIVDVNKSFLKQFSLSGKVVFISASSQGLGLAMAKAMALSGAHVYINGRSEQSLTAAVEQARDEGIVLHSLCGDMAERAEIDKLVHYFKEQYGGCDVLVNNLGIRMRQGWDAFDFMQMQTMLDSNLLAPMYLSQQMAQLMCKKNTPSQSQNMTNAQEAQLGSSAVSSAKERLKGGSMGRSKGRIISISSVAGPIARLGDAVYPITKSAISAMTRSLAVHYAQQGICCNAISPGAFATESNASLAADPIKGTHMSQRIPMQRWGQMEEIAGLAVFLASDLSSYLTGQVIAVDGGLSVLF